MYFQGRNDLSIGIKDGFRLRFRSTSPTLLMLVAELGCLPGDPPEIITGTFQMNGIFNSVIDERAVMGRRSKGRV